LADAHERHADHSEKRIVILEPEKKPVRRLNEKLDRRLDLERNQIGLALVNQVVRLPQRRGTAHGLDMALKDLLRAGHLRGARLDRG
jgi:hypothetical protein